MVWTSQAFVDCPSAAAARSTLAFRVSGRRRVIRASGPSSRGGVAGPDGVLDVAQDRVAGFQPDLDPARGELRSDLGRGLRDQVQERQSEARLQGADDAGGRLGGGLVGQGPERLEVGSDAG